MKLGCGILVDGIEDEDGGVRLGGAGGVVVGRYSD